MASSGGKRLGIMYEQSQTEIVGGFPFFPLCEHYMNTATESIEKVIHIIERSPLWLSLIQRGGLS